MRSLLLMIARLALCAGMMTAILISALSARAGDAETAAGDNQIYIPLVVGNSSSPGTPPAPTPIPGELHGTWVAGNLSSLQLYDPATGQWLPEVLGLGQAYELRADGTYTYAAQLTIGSFPCVSRSSTYETGTVRAQGAQLEFIATFYRNRTATCGGAPSETTTPPGPQQRTYLIQFDAGGFGQLYLDSGTATTNFVHKGGPYGQPAPMPVPGVIVGTWRSGGIDPATFFDPETKTWDESPAAGEWYRFNADSTYTYGGFASRVVNGCTQRVWLYVTGTVEGSPQALKLSPEYFPGPSLVRTHDSCAGSEPLQVVWSGGTEVLAWALDSTGRLTITRGSSVDTYTAD